MSMIGKIRWMRFCQGKAVREISHIMSLSRNTIPKWLDAPVSGELKYPPRKPQPVKLTAFHETLTQAFKADAHCPKRNRRTALV